MDQILVTGAAEFIGSHLTDRLLEQGHKVVGVDCFTGNYAPKRRLQDLAWASSTRGFRLMEGDRLDLDLRELLGSVDGVAHLAGEPGVRQLGTEPRPLFGAERAGDGVATRGHLERGRRAFSLRVVLLGLRSRWRGTPKRGCLAEACLALRSQQARRRGVCRALRPGAGRAGHDIAVLHRLRILASGPRWPSPASSLRPSSDAMSRSLGIVSRCAK